MEPTPNFRRTATVIWAALVAGVLSFFAVAMAVPMPGDPALAPVMLAAGAGLSLASVALSWLWAVRLRPTVAPGAAAPAPGALATTRLIVASALCEGSALFGIVGYLVTQDPRTLLAFALSLVALLAHFPGERHWAALSAEGAAREAPRNPMVRG